MAFGKYSKLMVAMVLAAALVLGGCVGSKSPAVYAVVDGENISREDFTFYLNLQRLHDPELEFSKEDKLDILDFMIEEHLLLAEAKKRGFEVDKDKANVDYNAFRTQVSSYFFDGSETMYYARLQELELNEAGILQLIEDYQLINKLIDDERDKAIKPDEEAIAAFYSKEKESLFAHGERRKARHILIDDKNFTDADDDADIDALMEDLALELYERILAGANFADLAKQYSQDAASAVKGGEIDFFEKRDVVPEFGTASFAAEVDVVLEPVKTTYGWHIIEVLEIQEPGFIALDDDLSARILIYLHNEAKEKQITNLTSNLRDQADIKTNFK